MGCGEMSGRMVVQHGGGAVVSGGGSVAEEKWRDSASMVADHSHTTDTTTSTYTTDDINQHQVSLFLFFSFLSCLLFLLQYYR